MPLEAVHGGDDDVRHGLPGVQPGGEAFLGEALGGEVIVEVVLPEELVEPFTPRALAGGVRCEHEDVLAAHERGEQRASLQQKCASAAVLTLDDEVTVLLRSGDAGWRLAQADHFFVALDEAQQCVALIGGGVVSAENELPRGIGIEIGDFVRDDGLGLGAGDGDAFGQICEDLREPRRRSFGTWRGWRFANGARLEDAGEKCAKPSEERGFRWHHLRGRFLLVVCILDRPSPYAPRDEEHETEREERDDAEEELAKARVERDGLPKERGNCAFVPDLRKIVDEREGENAHCERGEDDEPVAALGLSGLRPVRHRGHESKRGRTAMSVLRRRTHGGRKAQ